MAWRFQASKFKNTTPKLPKKEATIFDLPIGNLSCTNDGIKASDNFLAFHIEGEGGKLGVVTTDTRGRRLRDNIGIVCAHGEQVDDFSFLPFAQDLLVTCSKDEKLKLWRLSGDSTAISSTLETEVDVGGAQLDALRPHSTAAGIVAVASTRSGYVVDLENNKVVLEVTGFVDKGQSVDWSPDGKLLAISADKGKQVCIFDPRTGRDPIQKLEMHQGMGREGRILFCGDRLLSSGFTNKRVQEVRLVDTAKWGAPVFIQEFVSTTGVLIPNYDPDTKLLFLTGKGTNKLFMLEQQDRAPLLSPVIEQNLPEQSVGACISTKRSLSVMEGEVDTFYQLTKHSIVPVPCIVPRRTYRDFHADLFPDTVSTIAACSSNEWLQGVDKLPVKISLAPKSSSATASPPPPEPTPPKIASIQPTKTPTAIPPEPVPVAPARKSRVEVEEPAPPKPEVNEINYAQYEKTAVNPAREELPQALAEMDASTAVDAVTPPAHSPVPTKQHAISPSEDVENVKPVVRDAAKPVPEAAPSVVKLRQQPTENSSRQLSTRVRPKSCVVGMIASKFRHVETIVGVKANNSVFTNLRNVNTRLPPEANGACASGQFVAVPLSGPAGVVGIYNVDQPEKIPDGVMDGVFNKANVTDLQWNPFDDSELAVGTDVGVINFWHLSTDDGLRNEMEPTHSIKLGGEKILTLRWHPLASEIMAVALSDNSIEIINTKTHERKNKFVSHSGAVLSMAWSADGRFLASLGKDSFLNVHQPQLGEDCLIRQKKILENTRAARVLFACEDRVIIVVSFTRSSGRQVQLLDSYSLNVMHTHHLDCATRPLVPHYDYDSSVLFLAGKGDHQVNMFEVCYDSPYLLSLSPYMGNVGAQAIAFHNKKKCDLMAVEFQRGWRLTDKSLELMLFRVPRVRKDVFQSDLFPDALATWRPTLSADEWLSGEELPPLFESLRPDGVGALSVATTNPSPQLARRTVVQEDLKPQVNSFKSELKEKEKEVAASWSSQIQRDTELEQDRMEGVAEEEWS